jgi:hypothetical protein
MTSIDNDLARVENEIARANPVPLAGLPSADSPYARQILSEVLTASAPAPPPARRPGRLPLWLNHSGTARLGMAAAAVTVIAAITVSLLLPGSSPGNKPTAKHGYVTDVLTALAGAAAKQPAVKPPGRGQYQYTNSISRGIAEYGYRRPFSITVRHTRQIWIGWNGSGRLADASSDPRFLTPKDRAAWIADGRPHLAATGTFDQRFGPHGLSDGPVNEWKLPTNPARLGAQLRKRAIEGGPPGPAEDFVQVGDLLRETDAPPALRAALFKVAASIPGVRVLGRVTDRLGRTGIVVAYLDRPRAGKYRGMYGLDELIFAPKTSALLDEQTVLVNTKTHTRKITSWTAYIANGVVDSVTAVAPPYVKIATTTS